MKKHTYLLVLLLFIFISSSFGSNEMMNYFNNAVIYNESSIVNKSEFIEKELHSGVDYKTPSELSYEALYLQDLSSKNALFAFEDVSNWIELGGVERVPIENDYYILISLSFIYGFILYQRKRKKERKEVYIQE